MEKEQGTKAQGFSAKASQWLTEHKKVYRLIKLGIALLVILAVFLSLRLSAIKRMENFSTYIVRQEKTLIMGGKHYLLPGHAETCTVTADKNVLDEIAPNAKKMYDLESWVSSYKDGRLEKTNFETATLIQFNSAKDANNYLKTQPSNEDRNRYCLREYYFDVPKEDDEAANSTIYLQLQNLGCFLFRALVAFDMSTGL